MQFIKGLAVGLILTFVVTGIIGSTGSTGGFLDIMHFDIEGHRLYWSWPMFIAGTGLGWGLAWMMD